MQQQARRSRATSKAAKEKSQRELLHEHQLHRADLETRNGELKRIQLALEESRDKYVDLYEFAPVGYFTVSAQALIEEVNLTGSALLGIAREDLIDGRFEHFVAPQDLDRWRSHAMSVLQTREKQVCDLLLRRADGSTFYAHLESIWTQGRGQALRIRTAVADVTEHKRTEQERATLAAIVESCEDAIISMSLDGTIESWNRGAEKVYGYAASEIMGRNLSVLVPSDCRDEPRKALECIRRGGSIADYETVRVRKDGHRINISLTMSPVKDSAGRIIGASGIGRDLTARKQAEEALRIAAIAFQTQEGIMITDRAATIQRVNRAFTELTGYSADEAVGRTPALLKSGQHDQKFYQSMWEALGRENYWKGELWNRRKNGEVYPVLMTISAVLTADGRVTHYVGSFADITRQKEAAAKLHRLAFYDPLTELPNRRLLFERLRQAFAASARSGQHGAILFIDLDDFKRLNDSRGHDVGDQLLIQVAARLRACVRDDDSVARLGGDEFVVMLEDLSKQEAAAARRAEVVGEKIRRALTQPYAIGGHHYHSTPSIGVSLFFGHTGTTEELLKRADTALYRAKAAGRNTLRFFDPSLQAALEAHAELEEELRQVLMLRQLKLYVQMQTDSIRRVVGAEALLRWEHPQRGLVSPADFIPIAEASGLIVPIGRWVLETASAKLKTWAAQSLTRELQLAVNVSARQFRQPDFVAQVRSVLEHSGADPTRLTFELTESVVLDNVEYAIEIMHALKPLGVRFALDDFGTGYSSLSYLRRLPFDQLKIDRSFILDLATDPNAAVIVQTIIGMAKNLGLEVLAEGVETEEQLQFLSRQGCFAFQGTLFSPPLPVGDFERLLTPQDA